MGHSMHMPASLGEITPDWLNEAFARAGHRATAGAVDAAPMPGIVGAIGEVGVVTVQYDDNDAGLPTSFVGKCPLDDDMAKMVNSVMQMYKRESGFYRDLADDVELRTPRCFVNEADESGDHSVMLFERVDGVDGDILAGTSFANMQKLVVDLATMHGRFFGDERLLDLPWALDWSTPSFRMGIPIVQEAWATMREQDPDCMSAATWDFFTDTYVNDTEHWLVRMNQREWTFTHGDYELDNMLVQQTEGDGADDIVILDWQTVLRTYPGLDLGFLLMTSSNAEAIDREDELLDAYRNALLAAGGPAWSRDRVLEDCAWALPFHLTGCSVTAVQDMSAHGDNADRMRQRFDRFKSGIIAAVDRWDGVERLRD